MTTGAPATSANDAAQAPAAKPIQAWALYPPLDPGIARVDPCELMRLHRDKLAILSRVVSVSDELFNQRYLQPVESLARYVQALPASLDEHFAGPGGLFSLCLQVATFTAQAADGRIFTPERDTPTHHVLEPRYRYASFIAGLLSPLVNPLSTMTVTDATGQQWPKFMMPLSAWLEQRGCTKYWVTWPDSRMQPSHGSEAAAAFSQIIPQREAAWLDEGSPIIIRDLHAVAMGRGQTDSTTMGEIVKHITHLIIERDLLTARWRYGRLSQGSHLEVHYIDAMRTLVADGHWRLDNSGNLITHRGGLYIRWPEGLNDILGELARRGLTMAPRDPLTVEELLGHGGFLMRTKERSLRWSVACPQSGPADVVAVRVAEPGSIAHRIDHGKAADLTSSAAIPSQQSMLAAEMKGKGQALDGSAIATRFQFTPEVLQQATTDAAESGGAKPQTVDKPRDQLEGSVKAGGVNKPVSFVSHVEGATAIEPSTAVPIAPGTSAGTVAMKAAVSESGTGEMALNEVQTEPSTSEDVFQFPVALDSGLNAPVDDLSPRSRAPEMDFAASAGKHPSASEPDASRSPHGSEAVQQKPGSQIDRGSASPQHPEFAPSPAAPSEPVKLHANETAHRALTLALKLASGDNRARACVVDASGLQIDVMAFAKDLRMDAIKLIQELDVHGLLRKFEDGKAARMDSSSLDKMKMVIVFKGTVIEQARAKLNG